jgi:hypothetical protein
MKRFFKHFVPRFLVSFHHGGVAQWTSHPPQEQEDLDSNTATV